MGHKSKQSKIIESRIDFYYYAFRNILLVGLPLLVISTLVLSHLSFHSSATGSGTDRIEFSLSVSCTLSSVVNNEHSASINSGTYTSGVGKTTVTTLCNDGNGYAVYANGYSNNEEGNNKLINSQSPQNSIDTGLATSGLTSAWAMRLDNVANDPTPPTITNDYNATYGLVPNYYTKVAEKASGTTDMSQGSSFTTTYAVYASSSQYTGTYVGQVKYVLTHPSNKTPVYYMQDVADWKNELALEESVQAIDKRDGKSYWVTKLKDGNVWMTQNLDFDIATYINEQGQEVMKPLTSEDTDLTDHSLIGAYSQTNGYRYDESTGITGWTPATTAKTVNFEGTTVTGWQDSNTVPYSANKTDDTGTGHASLGNYYNWTAAIASNNSSSLTSDTLNDISQNPQNSICPKGWRLPTISNDNASSIDSTNEFARLNYLYNNGRTNTSAGLINNPLYFTYNGHIRNKELFQLSVYGFYLSSTVYSQESIYDLDFYSNGVYLMSYDNFNGPRRRIGMAVRCLARTED